MNLKQKIEEWGKFKVQPLKYLEVVKPTNFEQTVEGFIQALKEAAFILKVHSDFSEMNEYCPDREWLKKWGFEE